MLTSSNFKFSNDQLIQLISVQQARRYQRKTVHL
jgi:hypothetical protein